MGNRAVITTSPYKASNIGIYVHWNGGQESIEGFLKAARELGYRPPATDPNYALAGLAGLSVGLGTCDQLDCDNGDNGTWLVGDDWSLAGHMPQVGDLGGTVYPVGQEYDTAKCDAIAATIVAKVKAANAAHAPEVDA